MFQSRVPRLRFHFPSGSRTWDVPIPCVLHRAPFVSSAWPLRVFSFTLLFAFAARPRVGVFVFYLCPPPFCSCWLPVQPTRCIWRTPKSRRLHLTTFVLVLPFPRHLMPFSPSPCSSYLCLLLTLCCYTHAGLFAPMHALCLLGAPSLVPHLLLCSLLSPVVVSSRSLLLSPTPCFCSALCLGLVHALKLLLPTHTLCYVLVCALMLRFPRHALFYVLVHTHKLPCPFFSPFVVTSSSLRLPPLPYLVLFCLLLCMPFAVV